jgi:DNA-binding NarL/FixJ family response regulator
MGRRPGNFNKVMPLTLHTSKNLLEDITTSQNPTSFGSAEILAVALIDSRSLSRESLLRILDNSEICNVIPFSSCSELLEKSSEVLPAFEIILLNIGAEAIDNSEIVKNIALLNHAFLNASVIVIGDREDSLQVGQALLQGIRGYIPTTLTSGAFMGVLRLVQGGGTFVPADAFMETLWWQPIAPEAVQVEVAPPDLCKLSPRQWEVLSLLRQGKPNKVIAHELGLRESTVKVHVRSIMRKMRVKNRTEASFLASLITVDRKYLREFQ